MRGFVETVSFIHKPGNKEAVTKSLMKNLRLKNTQDAETGYQTLQWLYNLDIKPTLPGIQNMQRFLALSNPKVKTLKTEDVVDEGPSGGLMQDLGQLRLHPAALAGRQNDHVKVRHGSRTRTSVVPTAGLRGGVVQRI